VRRGIKQVPCIVLCFLVTWQLLSLCPVAEAKNETMIFYSTTNDGAVRLALWSP
jgi:hypothetical protein